MSDNSTSIANGLLGFEVLTNDPATENKPQVVVGVVEVEGQLWCNLCDPETGAVAPLVRIDTLTVAPNSLGLVQLVGKLHKFGVEMMGAQLG